MSQFTVGAIALEACEGLLREALTGNFTEINSRPDKAVDKFCHDLAVRMLETAGGIVRTHVQEASIELTTLWLSKAAQDPETYEKEQDQKIRMLLEALRKEGLRG